MQCAARFGQVDIMRLATNPVRIGSTDHGTVLKVRIQNIVRDIEIGMTAGIVLVVLDLLLRRVDLRHRVEACPTCRRLLHPQHRQDAVKPLMGCRLVLRLRPDRTKRHGHDQHGI